MCSVFKVTIEDERVVIKTDNEKGIIAKFNKSEIVCKNINGTISIYLKELKELVGKEPSGKIDFYYREVCSDAGVKDKKIKLEDSTDFVVENSLMTTYDETQWVFYFTVKDTFNCLFNKLPSHNSYYRENHLRAIYSDDSYLHMEIVLKTKYLKADYAELILQSRVTKQEVIAQGRITCLEKKENCYLQLINVKINLLDLCKIIANGDNVMDSDVLDMSMRVQFLESKVTNKNIRVKYSKVNKSNYDEEIWIENLTEEIFGLFPYYTKKYYNLSFHSTILSKKAYDTYINFTNNKDCSNDKKVFVVGEYPEKAQDNGLHFFKYVNDHFHEGIDCYYIVSKKSKDLDNLKGYEERILYTKSPEHIQKLLQADVIAHTHHDSYLYPFDSELLSKKIHGVKIFLQHGILAMKDMSDLYGKDAYPFDTDYFVVSSEREKSLVINELGYPEEQVLLTGLPRFDNLLTVEKNSFMSRLKQIVKKQDLKLLIMPTWRKEIKSEEDFISSQYYEEYNALVNSEKLAALVKNNSLKIQLYVHTNFQPYSKYFTSDFVEVVQEGNLNVQDLLKENDLLITDYSSVGLDFSLMKKRVIYYQFDNNLLESREVNLKEFLPGDIVRTLDEVIQQIEEFIKSNHKIKPEHEGKLADLFLFDDTKSNERLYKEICKIINK